MSKRRIGVLHGNPIIEGNTNEQTPNEIYLVNEMPCYLPIGREVLYVYVDQVESSGYLRFAGKNSSYPYKEVNGEESIVLIIDRENNNSPYWCMLDSDTNTLYSTFNVKYPNGNSSQALEPEVLNRFNQIYIAKNIYSRKRNTLLPVLDPYGAISIYIWDSNINRWSSDLSSD